MAPLVLHGDEAAGDPPLLRADSVTLSLRIISFAERKIDLASLKVDKPRVRIVIYPDGSNNLPTPAAKAAGSGPEQMIDLAVGHYEVTDGIVELDERNTPVNLRGDGLGLELTYQPHGNTPGRALFVFSPKSARAGCGASPPSGSAAARIFLQSGAGKIAAPVISALR